MNPAPGESIHDRVIRVELATMLILRMGVLASLLVIGFGMLLNAIKDPAMLLAPGGLSHLVAPGAAFPHTIREVASGAVALHGEAVMMVGVLLLMTLPAIRVLLAGVVFLLQGDRVFVLITLCVLGLLACSLFLGKIG